MKFHLFKSCSEFHLLFYTIWPLLFHPLGNYFFDFIPSSHNCFHVIFHFRSLKPEGVLLKKDKVCWCLCLVLQRPLAGGGYGEGSEPQPHGSSVMVESAQEGTIRRVVGEYSKRGVLLFGSSQWSTYPR